MACSECGDKKKNTAKDFTKAVVEINNPEKIVLFRKVVVPASMGTEEDYPASVGKFYNVLLQYEANGDTYLYSSDGIPTMLSTDVSELQRELDQLGIKVDNEIADRISADDTITSSVNSLSSSLSAEVTARTNADTALQTAINNEKTARQNADNTLQTNINNEKTARVNADTALGNRLTTVEGIAATALQPAAIDKVVMTDLSLNANPSTATVQLDGSKENLLSGAQTTKNIPLPVASHDQAGVMNSATFDAIAKNTQDIANIKGEVVAITGLPSNPSQARLAEEWLAASGETELINGAGIFDATNNKVWTYYLNDTTWHMTDASGSVQISNFTNDTPGLIKGSTATGQVFAESNGTGSVNGWDALSSAVSSNTSNIGSLQTTVAGKQDKLVAGTNINIAADGKTISATDTKYTAGSGLNLNGTQFSVDTNTIQSKLTAGNAINIDGNTINADVYPADYFTATATVSGEGSSMNLAGTANIPLDSLQMYGDTTQQTYSGKNLFNINGTSINLTASFVISGNDITATMNSTGGNRYSAIEIPNSDDLLGKTVTLSYILKNISGGNTARLSMYFGTSSNPAQNVIFDGVTEASSSVGETVKKTTTIPSSFPTSGQSIYVIVYANTNSTSVSTIESAEYSNIQLEVDSTATSYEPYVGGIASPNPDYPQPVQTVTGRQVVRVSGKNLIKTSNGTDTQVGVTRVISNGVMTFNGTATATYNRPATDWFLLPKGTYTLSANNPVTGANGAQIKISQRPVGSTVGSGGDIDSATVQMNSGSNAHTTFTTTEDVEARIYPRFQSGTSLTNFVVSPQLEVGSDSTTFEAYQGKDYEVNLGKNLLDNSSPDIVSSGITWTPTSTGGTFTRPSGTWGDGIQWRPNLEIGKSYTFQASTPSNVSLYCDVRSYTDDTFTTVKTAFLTDGRGDIICTFIPDSKYIRIRFANSAAVSSPEVTDLQLEKGSTATTYAPYFTPIELCKIGTYSDDFHRTDGVWRIRKRTKSVVLTGDAEWTNQHSEGVGGFALPWSKTIFTGLALGDASMQSFCTHFTFSRTNRAWLGDGTCGFNTGGTFWFQNADYDDDLAGVKAWLNSIDARVYYPLASSTSSIITTTALSDQLENLANALGYDEATNIVVTSSNLPGILSVSAYKNSLDGTHAALTDALNPEINSSLSLDSNDPLKNSAVSRFTRKLVTTAISIPSGSDLNTTEFLKVGTFACTSNTPISTFSNCPSPRAFYMDVESPISSRYDNENTETYVYRVRTITDYYGNQWVQHAESGSVAGQFNYGSWQRITTDAKLIYTRDNLSPASDTPADWIALFGNESSTNVTKTGKGYYVTYYNTASRFTNQPSTYGYLETIINPSGLYQRWKVSASGHMFYRSGTSSAWADSDTSGAFIPLSEGNQATWYGTCNAAATDTALTTTISGFKLVNGIRVSIKFENGHTTSDPTTLNVSGTGAKAVVREDSTSTNLDRLWRAKQVMDFVYDGTNYVVVNGVKATTNYYGVTMLSNSVTSTGTGTAATSSAVKTAYDLAGTKAKITMSATDPGEGAAIGDNEFIAVYT